MKKSMIRAIFNGERGNVQTIKMTEEEHKLMSTVSDTYDNLLKELTPKQKELQEKFVHARESALCAEVSTYYIEGFKLGLLIGIECMEE